MEEADKFAYFTADEDPLSVYQGRDYLEAISKSGINFLNQKGGDDGFFLMIESSQIDWGGHANKSEWIIEEFKEFNTVIGNVLAWAEADGETLVVLTADHETGGYTIQVSELFSGLYENTAIYHKMREAFGWKTKNSSSK